MLNDDQVLDLIVWHTCISYFGWQWGLVLRVLVAGVYKPHKLDNFDQEVCPQGPRMAAQYGTLNGGGGDLGRFKGCSLHIWRCAENDSMR